MHVDCGMASNLIACMLMVGIWPGEKNCSDAN